MKRITFFILSIFCFTACNNEIVETENLKPLDLGQQITLLTPKAETVSVYSAANESECRIDTIWVIAFDPSTHTKKWAEKIPGSKIVNNGQAMQLLPQLSNKPDNGDRIVCIANADSNPDTATVTFTNINTKFKLENNNYYYGGEYLPMYGDFIWSTSDYTCTMIRAVAKIQVLMGTSVPDVTGNFSAENVVFSVHAGGDYGYIKPSTSGAIGINQTSAPCSTNSLNHFFIQNEGATEDMNHVYLYEYPSSNRTGYDINTPISNKVFNAHRQHLILTKNNAPAASTYYRLDFYNSKDSVFIDTNRNHHYIFTINKVRSEGYTNINEACSNPGSNIEYSVVINDNSRHITSNGQYAIVSSVDTAFINSAGQQAISTVKYQLGAVPLGAGTLNTVTIESGNLGTVSPSIITGIHVPVIINPPTLVASGSIQGVILFKLGNINHRLYVKVK